MQWDSSRFFPHTLNKPCIYVCWYANLVHYSQDTKDKASSSSAAPVIANCTPANQLHVAAQHATFTTVSLPCACACCQVMLDPPGTAVLEPVADEPSAHAVCMYASVSLIYCSHHQAVIDACLHVGLIIYTHACKNICAVVQWHDMSFLLHRKLCISIISVLNSLDLALHHSLHAQPCISAHSVKLAFWTPILCFPVFLGEIFARAKSPVLTLMRFMQDLPLHSTQPHASLTSEPDKANAIMRSTKRCYSPDWLLSHHHHRQQVESPSAPQDLRNRIGEDLWAPNWQSAPSQSSSSQPGGSQASPLQAPPPHTPHGISQGGAVAGPPVSAADSDKGKGVLFFHGHIPRGSPRHPADAGAMGQEANLCYRHKLEDMALHEPLRFVDRNGLATPFFRTVSSLSCTT